MKGRRWIAAGAASWIIGVALTVIGMNVDGKPGQWVSLIGNILFLAGLAVEGIWWFKREKTGKEENGRQE